MSSVDVEAAAEALRDRLGPVPRVAIVLGSGLGHLAAGIDTARSVPFSDVPGLPASGVQGHSGMFGIGTLGGRDVLLQSGRYHAYEGHPMDLVVAPVRILAALGVEVLVLTNAAGSLVDALGPGDLMVLEDHINMMFRNPLIGAVVGDEERFPDMSAPYDAELRALALTAAGRAGVQLHEGVYAAVLGPSYETAAEVRMLGRLGATVVGRSTVPEATTASALGLRCLAFSMVTNKGTGLSDETVGHDEVIAVGREAGLRLEQVLAGVVSDLGGLYSDGAK